jgi:L-lactate transport
MWQQNYSPVAGDLGWSACAAALPMVVLLFMLAVWRRPAWISGLVSLATAAVMAIAVYGMPIGAVVSSAAFGAAFGLLPIGWITFSAILLYRLTLATGQFETIKISLATLTSDRRLQALLIAFAFGAFIEGAAGSGVPVAVCAAMLAGLGFDRMRASAICLLANTSPVAFGAIGTPVLTLAITTGLPMHLLSTGVGRICAPLSLCVPAYLTVLVAGWKGLRGAMPAAVVCGVTFAAVQLTVSQSIGPQLTDILASMAAMASLLALFRIWRPREAAVHGAAAASRPALPASAVWKGWLPYALLAVLVLLWGVQPVRRALQGAGTTILWPALHNRVLQMPPVAARETPYAAEYRLDVAASPGTACFIAGLLAAAFAGMRPHTFCKVFAETARQMIFPMATIASVLALAFLMNYCGATATLGLAFAATGRLFPFFSALLGWIGVFLTGSDASSNALFGNLQVVTARRLGLNPILTASANSAGGVMGKMISVQSIAVAAAATGMPRSDEARLFRLTIWHSAALASLIGLLVTVYAYVLPRVIP